MNRLDEVLGPENWWDDYSPLENSVICRLTVRLPDGTTLTKSDAGGCAGMADPGDDDKSGFSDAFKRAAVKFGVGRYLYGDGTANYRRNRPQTTNGDEKTDESPGVSSASSDIPVKDGRWLLWAARTRDTLPWFDGFGLEHGYPTKIEDWSQGMVATAIAAKTAAGNGARNVAEAETPALDTAKARA